MQRTIAFLLWLGMIVQIVAWLTGNQTVLHGAGLAVVGLAAYNLGRGHGSWSKVTISDLIAEQTKSGEYRIIIPPGTYEHQGK